MFREWGNVTENYLNKEVLPLLQKLMRIQDWDIEVFLIHKFEMGYISGNPNNVGHCVRHRLTNLAYIHINLDSRENEKDWVDTLIHELIHVLTDDFIFYIEEFIPDNQKEIFEIKSETLTNAITRSIKNSLKAATIKEVSP